MGVFYFKQPNGLYCRFSTVTDCPTHYNCTKEELKKIYIEQAEQVFETEFEYHVKDFNEIDEWFLPTNMKKKEFNKIKKEMEKHGD